MSAIAVCVTAGARLCDGVGVAAVLLYLRFA